MAWTRFADIQSRFTHIDAEFVSAEVRHERGLREVSLTVRFYPWWEHPSYIAARQAGQPWGFTDSVDGARDVTVRAVHPVAVKLSNHISAIDWALSADHPVLWGFDRDSTIYLNAPVVMCDLIDGLMARNMPFVSRRDLQRYLDPSAKPVPSRAVVIPAALHGPVVEELARMEVPAFVPHPPQPRPELLILLFDGEDYVVAGDFLIDVPEFEHRPEWFRPG